MLTNFQIKQSKPKEKQYKIYDAENLYMLIHPSGGKYWRFNYTYAGKQKTIAFGTYPRVTLDEARKKKIAAQKELGSGLDPSAEKKKREQKKREDHENTFEVVAKEWFEKQKTDWSEAHAHKVWRRLEMHALPIIGKLPIKAVRPNNIIECIEFIQNKGALDIAKRCLQAIKSIMTYAAVREMCERSAIMDLEPKHLLQSRQVIHNPHLEERELPHFLQEIEQDPSTAHVKLAMKIMLLTFVRSSELREAVWDEFDFKKDMWKIPASRMKMPTPHLVPLAKQTKAALLELKGITGMNKYLFPQERDPKKVISDATLTRMVYRAGYKGRLTVHGIRGTASTILRENGFNEKHVDRQLSHMERNKVKASYDHAQHIKDRVPMMQWWADFLDEKRAQ